MPKAASNTMNKVESWAWASAFSLSVKALSMSKFTLAPLKVGTGGRGECELVSLPLDVIRILYRQGRQSNLAPAQQRVIDFRDLVHQDAQRPAVGNNMVHAQMECALGF